MGAAAFGACSGIFLCNDQFFAVRTVISRYPVSPPELTGNTPVTDIVSPVKIYFLHPLRQQGNVPVFHCLYSRLNQFVHFYKPLLFYHRLHCGSAAVMGSHIMGMGHNFYQKSLLFQFLHHLFSGFVAVHSLIFSAVFVDSGIVVQHINFRQVMAFAHFKVIGVMGRGNLYAASSEFLIHIMVSHHRNLTSHQRKNQGFAYNILIPFILRIDCHCSVSQQRFRPCSGDFHESSRFSLYRIINMPEKAVLFLMLHFRVRNRSLAHRTPIYNPGALVNQALFI